MLVCQHPRDRGEPEAGGIFMSCTRFWPRLRVHAYVEIDSRAILNIMSKIRTVRHDVGVGGDENIKRQLLFEHMDSLDADPSISIYASILPKDTRQQEPMYVPCTYTTSEPG